MVQSQKEITHLKFFVNELETCLNTIDNLASFEGVQIHKKLALGNIDIIRDACNTLEKELKP